MRIDILTLFPNMFTSLTDDSIIARANQRGIININLHQIRDYTENRQNQVDDYPYGGGRGCVMQPQPLHSCWKHVKNEVQGLRSRSIYLSPQGKVFSQDDARRLGRDYDNLIFICGHYEGIDQRFIDLCVDEEISLGDFVLTGGEIPAMAVTDSVCRLLPGVLSDEECFTDESHWNGLLEYPQYSRPEKWQGLSVPDILISGDHGKVEKWRRKESLKRTLLLRPDMFQKLIFDKSDLKLLSELKLDLSPVPELLRNLHTDRITVRKSIENDLPRIKSLRAKYLQDNQDLTLESLHSNGEHFSIYADGLGFCGEAGYILTDDAKSAEIFIFLLPHCRKKGIGTYSAKIVMDKANTDRFKLAKNTKQSSIWHRLGFTFQSDGIVEAIKKSL